ncbi:M20 metallopeptidase family protein [Nakamurella aerolata]|uniref:Amidohydrolase n=1 Tax=Nakamurella aerolata TaxID=1656892 RepID=A0A849A6D3_9ACTN|nr:M20 family metallopeptidase [Nakamurella aerolata]NNG35607.1 amidohydrolase [Nakamurella aerolata]
MTNAVPDLVGEAAALLPDLVALRRDLHANPEIALQLPRTQAAVLKALEGLDLELTTGTACTSVIGVLRGRKDGRTWDDTVLLRGDMDALPVREDTDLPYAADNGNMHACGHDLHTAGLVGAARLLAAHGDELPGNVLFMFQPGEEGHDGAETMLGEGLLDVAGAKPVASYAIHVGTSERGNFTLKPGPTGAGSNELRIVVHGKGGHGSRPVDAIDPVPALVEIAGALQTMTTRRFGVFDPIVVTVTQLQAGEAINVIPDSARLGATVRTLSPESIETLKIETKRLADGIASAHGCTAEVDFKVGYPVTVNDDAETARTRQVLIDTFGADRVIDKPFPTMGSEDFSLVLNEVPGTFVHLGACPPDIDPADSPSNHSARVRFDDAVLGDQAAALATLAFTRLAG